MTNSTPTSLQERHTAHLVYAADAVYRSAALAGQHHAYRRPLHHAPGMNTYLTPEAQRTWTTAQLAGSADGATTEDLTTSGTSGTGSRRVSPASRRDCGQRIKLTEEGIKARSVSTPAGWSRAPALLLQRDVTRRLWLVHHEHRHQYRKRFGASRQVKSITIALESITQAAVKREQDNISPD